LILAYIKFPIITAYKIENIKNKTTKYRLSILLKTNIRKRNMSPAIIPFNEVNCIPFIPLEAISHHKAVKYMVITPKKLNSPSRIQSNPYAFPNDNIMNQIMKLKIKNTGIQKILASLFNFLSIEPSSLMEDR